MSSPSSGRFAWADTRSRLSAAFDQFRCEWVVDFVLEVSKLVFIQCRLPHAWWNRPLHVRDLVLVSIRFLRGPFAQRLSAFLGIPKVVDPDPPVKGSDKEVEKGRWQMWMNFFQQFQRWAEGHTATACLGRLDDEEQLVGLAFIALCPFARSVADAGYQQEATTDGRSSVRS